jgi:response regulator RpfG family c-di-GMP phosphodiesterase
VLRKVGPLEDEEQAMIRLHPEIGAAMLAGIDTWDDVRSIIRHHHERFDGTGYPDGLAGTDIPIGARIVALADAVDVMQSGRPYAPARPHEQILDILKRERGSQFDPEMVDAFLAVTGESAAHANGIGPHEPQLSAAQDGPAGAAISEWLLREAGVVRRTPAS